MGWRSGRGRERARTRESERQRERERELLPQFLLATDGRDFGGRKAGCLKGAIRAEEVVVSDVGCCCCCGAGAGAGVQKSDRS